MGGIINQKYTGDICAPKTFSLPLGTGTIGWKGLNCPQAAGAVSVPMDILLSGSLPPFLQSVTMTVKTDMTCMEIKTSPAEAQEEENFALQTAGGQVKLGWTDCGSAHGKAMGLSPDTITLGATTSVIGSVSVDEVVSGGSFEVDLKAGIINQKYTGDICAPKSFSLPLGTGTIGWKGLNCPQAAGAVSIPMDILLSGSLPPFLQSVTMTVK